MKKTAIFDLAGVWDFKFRDASDPEPDINEVCFDDFAAVPGCFDLVHAYYLKRGTGFYRRYVDAGGEVELFSEGLGLRGKIYWDRKLIADIDAPFSKNTFRFNAGDYGRHEIIVAVNNEFDDSSSSMWHRDYDFYAHGGIYRKLTLKPAEPVFEREIKILTADIDCGKVEITLVLDGEIKNISEAEVYFDNALAVNKITLLNGRGKAVLSVPDFKLWSPEAPNLHHAVIKVGDVVFEKTFGIRKVEAKNGKIYLNGKKLHIIGYNRHDAHPDFGYAVPTSVRMQDLQVLKKLGGNCFRGSHYPQCEEFLDMCDRMGILVWEESLGWGNREKCLTDPEFQAKQIRETRKMALASINHPSIIFRGFLNEAVTTVETAKPIVKALADVLHEVDPTTLVTFATDKAERDVCLEYVDVISFNTYPCWYSGNEDQFMSCKEVDRVLGGLAEFASKDEYKDKPVLISEIGAEALVGLHGGQRWSEEYQSDLHEAVIKYTLENDRYSGVLIWQFCDCRTFVSNAAQTKAANFNFKGALDSHRVPKDAWRRVEKFLKEYEKQPLTERIKI